MPGATHEARREEAKRNRPPPPRTDRRRAAPNCPSSTRTPKQPRRLELGDVAILFRTLSDVQVYEEALREYGLDYYLVGGHAFYAQQEIFDVLNLLRAVASTADEVSLAGVLRSPFFALADETLFWLADSAGSLNAGLLADALPPQLSPEEARQSQRRRRDDPPPPLDQRPRPDRHAAQRRARPHRLRRRAARRVPRRTQARQPAQARRAGPRGRPGGVTDLDGFITQLAQFIAREPKESLAATLPEAADVIRLMTIHHAKGLEFPLVVVPDLDRQPLLRAPPRRAPPRPRPARAAPPMTKTKKSPPA